MLPQKFSLLSCCPGASRVSSPDGAGHRASSVLEAGTSGFLSSADLDLNVPMEFQQRSQASSHCGDLECHFPFRVSKGCQASCQLT